jgi:hypothetical protein
MRVFLVSIALFASLSCAARAGTTGGVSGFVFDRDKPLVGVDVFVVPLTARNESIHDVRALPIEDRKSDSRGFFTFLSVAPGYYLVYVRLAGYYYYCPQRIAIEADQADSIRLFMSDKQLLVRCRWPPRYAQPVSATRPFTFDVEGRPIF